MHNNISGLELTAKQELPAGRFSSWLRRMRSALVKNTDVDVPCGGCNACCRSSYFIHIGPEETETLARIPKELQFAAPGRTEGHVLLGYDEKGHCPMLVDEKCSIYAHRPLTCRIYDCRIFPAVGTGPSEDDKALITQQVLHWKFNYTTERDYRQHAAVQTAAKFLREHAVCFAAESNSTQLAILAIKVYDVFLRYRGKNGRVPPDPAIVKAIMRTRQKFEERSKAL